LLADVWTEKRELQGRELFQAQQLAAKVDTEFKIRFPAGLDPFPNPDESMRLVCEDVVYDITYVSEVGRREGLRILAFRRAEAA
jgi:SPP1 family predicted phage head-tail adaptor